MYIKSKKNSRRNEDIFIFYFKDEEDFKGYINGLETFANNYTMEKINIRLMKIIDILKSRVDDKYKTEDNLLSGCLFTNEMIELTTILSLVAVYSL